MEKKQSKIQAIKGFGVSSYKIEFSIKDIQRMKAIADELKETYIYSYCGNGEDIKQAYTLLESIFNATVGYQGNQDWDFLSDNKEEN